MELTKNAPNVFFTTWAPQNQLLRKFFLSLTLFYHLQVSRKSFASFVEIIQKNKNKIKMNFPSPVGFSISIFAHHFPLQTTQICDCSSRTAATTAWWRRHAPVCRWFPWAFLATNIGMPGPRNATAGQWHLTSGHCWRTANRFEQLSGPWLRIQSGFFFIGTFYLIC